MLEVSELGLPVAALPPVLDAFAEQWRQPLWSGNRERFAAVGGEDGLFIVVPEGRTWFMTEALTATIHPLDVDVATPGGRLAGLPAAYQLVGS